MEVKGKYVKGHRHLELINKTKVNPTNFLSLHQHILRLYLADMLTVLGNLRTHYTDQEVFSACLMKSVVLYHFISLCSWIMGAFLLMHTDGFKIQYFSNNPK